MEAIKLWAVVKTKLLKDVGIDTILKPLVDDLKIMGTVGWDMKFDGVNIRFRAFLESVLGDTPAVNSLLGFKEGVGFALSKCRLCQCPFDKMQNCFSENQFVMLTSRDHRYQCKCIETATTVFFRNKLSAIYGINRRTSLLECPFFDICLNTPLDVMHIMLEGVVPYELKELLYHCVEEEMFTIDDLSNSTTDYFSHFRYDSKTRPTEITRNILFSTDNSLKQTSDQMHSLLRAMPFILATIIPVRSVEFQFVKQLLQITNILFSAVITLGTLGILKTLIVEHLEQFKQLFPNSNIIPKQHYLQHFPNLIKKVGPPTRHSASRFESSHQGYKRKIKVSQNFKNVPYSIAISSQTSASLANENEHPNMHPIFANKMNTGSYKNYENLDYLKNKLGVFENIDQNDVKFAKTTKLLNLGSQKFIKDYTFVAAEVSNFVVNFGLIRNIFLVNGEHVFFELQMYESNYFDDNFQSFVMDIQEPDMPGATVFFKPENLLDYHAFHLHEQNGQFFIQVPYDMFGILDLAEEGKSHLHNQLHKVLK